MMIYNGCNVAYRLNQSGNINVPLAATNEFCQGPCLSGSKQLLDCIDNMFSSFVFYNKASVGQIREVINQGCSYTNRRGHLLFNFLFYFRFCIDAIFTFYHVLSSSLRNCHILLIFHSL